MELRHLRYFAAVAEELHFSRAAERLHISQPPLSRQIQDLERELGVQLFHRNRGVELTEAGQILLARAQRTIAAAERFAHTAEAMATGMVRSLRVGFPATWASALPGAVIQRLLTNHPDLDLDLVVGHSGHHLRAVRAEQLDAAFVRQAPGGDGLPSVSLYREPLVLALRSDHPIARHSVVTCDQLSGEPLVMAAHREEPAVRDAAMAVISYLDPAPRVVLDTTTLESVYSGVVSGLGIAVVAESSSELLDGVQIVIRPLVPPPPATEMALVWFEDRAGHPLEALLDSVTAWKTAQESNGSGNVPERAAPRRAGLLRRVPLR